ncbi:DUF3850 domain-containing protein [Arenibacter sp. 6A1]|uniref:DUF3850 domain-containing protein n=1 Tax=Arenibacter sp. 6A1 TaxID=2720391 RepID=UPI00144619D5|nr:DUF3850 domain-containing protein [Arenibacter sp. 6A1]NKI28243.1 DUF3850 domain-containing protein [Arenibacter sp. 6A1]
MDHKIKILADYASKHLRGVKPWELRKNDRNYKEGDFITFVVVTNRNTPTGMTYRRKIIDVFEGGVYGLQDGFCILTISNVVY